jgi:predicted enzyme related to lactoylglutathione lyase
MDPVVHFEMSYEDKNRAAEFYSKAFGWKPTMLGPEMGDYVSVHTGETDENNMIKKPGMINGGLYKKSEKASGVSVVVAVEDIYEAMKRVKEAGGTVLGGRMGADKPDDIPGIGLFAGIIDTEGNKFAMLQPTRRM